MTAVHDYINSDTLTWLQDNRIKYKLVDVKSDQGALNILYNENFCIKIYDRLGHGFGVTVNVVDKYDESIYTNDIFSLHWVFEHFQIKQASTFNKRTKEQYLENLPNLITDLKNIIPRLNKLTSIEWKNMVDWITIKAKKQFD